MLNYEENIFDYDINTKEKFINDFKYYLYGYKNKREIVFLCIGTDRVIGDSLGPLVGTNLQKRINELNISNIDVYGTLKQNVTYKNINEKIHIINCNYKNPLIIVIDAALCDKESIGKIIVNDLNISIGKGVGKNSKDIGDINIKAVVAKNYMLPQYNFKILQNIPLYKVICLANIISDGIIEVIKNI